MLLPILALPSLKSDERGNVKERTENAMYDQDMVAYIST